MLDACTENGRVKSPDQLLPNGKLSWDGGGELKGGRYIDISGTFWGAAPKKTAWV